MTVEAEKAIRKMEQTRDPAERAHIKSDIDQMPLSSGELDQTKEREHDRKQRDIKKFREKRK